MANRLKIAGIAGSLRAGSYNRMLLREAQRLAPPEIEFNILEIGDLPLFNEDVEDRAYPEAAARLKRGLADADGLLIATPEYNYGIPGVLKNALDWASRPAGESPLEDLPVALMGASVSFVGTARAQLALRNVFVFTKSPVLPGPEVLVAGAQGQFGEDGRLTNPDTEDFIRDLLDRFEGFVLRWPREPAY
ncbi:MAG: NADPH-dependent FMN reductase [Dehalococcoidia bacterium]